MPIQEPQEPQLFDEETYSKVRNEVLNSAQKDKGMIGQTEFETLMKDIFLMES